jgi:hypothetical protein
MKQKVQKLNLSETTHCQLRYLSKITGLSMTEIVRQIMENITPISVMFSRGCSFECSYMVTESATIIHLHGVSHSFACGTSPNDSEMQKEIEGKLGVEK